MQTKSDAQLLKDHAERGQEGAFAEIVHRHTNLVYSAALRQVDSPDIAAEVAQRVFIGLAQAAQCLSHRLAEDASLAGWLCRSARNVSLNHRRDEFRRQSRERQAMEILDIPENSTDWERLRPVLDAAMTELDESDYDALVMRFFRNQDLRSVGRALGVTDDAAQKRVARALNKLRDLLTQRGITTTAAALSLILSAHAVQAAPVGLASAISTAAALVSTALKTSTTIAVAQKIVMTTLQKALIAAALAGAVGTGIYQAHRATVLEEQTAALRLEHDALAKQLQDERTEASNKLAAAQLRTTAPKADLSELMKLRAQVASLRDKLKSSAAVPETDSTSAEMKSWLVRVKMLKDRLAQMPDRKIPEFRLLTDQDWLDAVKDVKQLQTDADFAKAMNALRDAAKREFSTIVQGGLNGYAQANNGALPASFNDLQPYLSTPLDDSVLERYEFAQPGTISEKTGSLIDENGNYYASRIQVAIGSISSSTTTEDELHPAIQAFLAANGGQSLTDPTQLLPYVQTSDEKTALQKAIQSFQQGFGK